MSASSGVYVLTVGGLCAAIAGAVSHRIAKGPLHIVFWQERDVRDARGVTFAPHPYAVGERSVLLPSEPERPALWFSPTDALPDGDGIRVYYQRVDSTEKDYLDRRTWCVGTLRGRKLTLPDLRLHPQSWGGPANVVLRRSPRPATWGGFNVFQIASTTSGLALLHWDQPDEGPAGLMAAWSPDGIHWTKDARRDAVFTEHNDAFTVTRHLADGGWLLYQTRLLSWPNKPYRDNLPGMRRVISLRHSQDLLRWSAQETVLEPDAEDAPECEFYLLKAFRLADRLVGFLMKYYADPKAPGKHSALYRTELVFSRDGESWERPYRWADLGLWTYVTPFEHEGRLCTVAYEKRGLTLCRTRLDGLASCGTATDGSFVCQSFVAPRSELVLNAECRRGAVEVEALDDAGRPIEGFGRALCRFAGVDGTDLPLRWAGRSLDELAGQRVHLRFALRRARVYAVRQSPTPQDGRLQPGAYPG